MTRTKDVAGMMFDGHHLIPTTVTMRFSYDHKSSTISLSNEEDLMLQVDFDDLKALLEQANA